LAFKAVPRSSEVVEDCTALADRLEERLLIHGVGGLKTLESRDFVPESKTLLIEEPFVNLLVEVPIGEDDQSLLGYSEIF